MTDIIIFLIMGLVAGLLSGLVGIGGGIIIVPGMSEWLQYHQFETSHAMQISIGTALSCILVISLISGLTHRKMGSIRWDLVRLLAPGTVTGAFIGVQIADSLPSELLRKIFAVILCLIAIQLLFFDSKNQSDKPKFKSWILVVCGVFIGLMSGLVGLGGGIFIVPLLLFNGIAITQSSSTALWCTLPTVTVATATAIWTGYNETDLLPNSIGYVYWPATLAICSIALVAAPVGVRLAHKLSRKFLKSVLICCMLVIIVRLIFR